MTWLLILLLLLNAHLHSPGWMLSLLVLLLVLLRAGMHRP